MATVLGRTFRAMQSRMPAVPQKARTFAAAGFIPITLSMRTDSLMAMCTIDGIVHYVPQDLLFVAGWYMYERNQRNKVNYTTQLDDVEGKYAAWLEKKGLDENMLTVSKGSSKWNATFLKK